MLQEAARLSSLRFTNYKNKFIRKINIPYKTLQRETFEHCLGTVSTLLDRCVHADDCLSRTLHLPLSLDARSSTTLTGLLTGVCTLTIASLALCTCLSPWTRAPPLLSLGYSQVCAR